MSELISLQTELTPSENPAEMRAKIMKLESAMMAMPEQHVHIEPKHYFIPGIYMREITIPKGITITGKIHKSEHMCVLSRGEVSVYTDQGIKRLKASTVVHSKPGMKRVLYAHEDSVWINVHYNPSDERDLDKLEDIFIAKTFEEAYLSSDRSLDEVLKLLGKTREELTEISENQSDQIGYMTDQCPIRIGPSPIHGDGVFSTEKISNGSIIAPARIGTKRTPVGRYCNHGAFPNSKMILRENGDVDLVAIMEINIGEEILSDYYFNFTNTRGVKCLG